VASTKVFSDAEPSDHLSDVPAMIIGCVASFSRSMAISTLAWGAACCTR
jgi:hypothetical protein